MYTRSSIACALMAAAFLTTACKSKEEALKAAEDEAQFMAEKKARLVKGVGQALEGEGKAAAETLAKGSAQVVRGVESGAVEGFSDVPIAVSANLASAGVKGERAALLRDDPKKPKVKVYLVLDKPYKGDLTLIGRTADDKEVGRSKISIDEPDTGKYVVFEF